MVAALAWAISSAADGMSLTSVSVCAPNLQQMHRGRHYREASKNVVPHAAHQGHVLPQGPPTTARVSACDIPIRRSEHELLVSSATLLEEVVPIVLFAHHAETSRPSSTGCVTSQPCAAVGG